MRCHNSSIFIRFFSVILIKSLNYYSCFINELSTRMFKKKFFKNFLDDESDGSAPQTKFIQSRIKLVQKYIPELGKALADYIDKNARARDCVDQISKVLDNYAKAENVTTAFKFQISDFANILLDVGTKKDIYVHAMETRVLEHLGEHKKLCSTIQAELKLSLMASTKENNWIRHLRRIKESQFHNPEQLSLAEAECLKAKGESARSCKNLEEQIDIFERNRLNAVKETLLAWSLSELYYHSKALELFTEAYRMAADIDVNTDIEEFRSKLRSTASTPRSDSFHRSESVLRLLSLPSSRSTRFAETGIPHPSSLQSSSRSSLPQTIDSHED